MNRTDRLTKEDKSDQRQAGQRDRDRILYSSSFRRLAGVTQVVTPAEGHVFHNRLTHTLEVAQIARRLAEKLLREQPGEAEQRGGLDPEVAEAAALAHDLGHPPFGHIAEHELDVLGRDNGDDDGFEGNAQSFRILTKYSAHRIGYQGLNLSRATLNAVLKYPWLRNVADPNSKRWRKFGAYRSERKEFEFARQLNNGDEYPSLEAAIMDYADAVAYSVHDLDDFYRAGLIPLERLVISTSEFDAFLMRWQQREHTIEVERHKEALRELMAAVPIERPYIGTFDQRAVLKAFTSGLIGQFIHSVNIRTDDEGVSPLSEAPGAAVKLEFLKALIWDYVTLNPRLATQQYGEKRVVHVLFDTYKSAIVNNERQMLPPRFHQALEELPSLAREVGQQAAQTRLAIDIIASFTDDQATAIFRRFTGVSIGSVLDILHG